MKVQKIVLTAGTGLAFLLCIAGFVFAYQAYAEASKVKATLGDTFKKLSKIYNEDVFPNPTNMAVLAGDTAWTTNWYQLLIGDLRAAALPQETLSSSGFIQKLQDASVELQKKATAEGGKVLPDGFAFGFDRYLGGSSHMPKPENVKRLAVQFMMVEAVTREILESHVTAISQIDREIFEADAVEAPTTPGRSRSRAAAAGATAAPVVGVADSRYPGQHFTFVFTADEKALSEVLGRIAKMPMFVVVTELRIDRLDRGLRPRSEKPAVDADKAKTAAMPPSQRVVSGPEIPPLLKTQLQIDVYTFEGV